MTVKNGGIPPYDRTRSCLKINQGITTHGRKEVEVGMLVLGNHKSSVIVDKVLRHFECLSSKFEEHVSRFGTTVNNKY